jgi:hypothetical protein
MSIMPVSEHRLLNTAEPRIHMIVAVMQRAPKEHRASLAAIPVFLSHPDWGFSDEEEDEVRV